MNDRQREMVDYVKENKRVSVKKLSEKFFVSEMTVRRDLKELEKQKLLERYNGGATYCENDIPPFEVRKLQNIKEKSVLSKRTRKYLHDSLTIFIDSSSTCMYIIPLLAEYRDIKIVTNSVQSTLVAAKYHIPCILAGGAYNEYDMCTIGSETENYLRNINVDIAFFSVLGISDDGIISDNDEYQTAVRKAVMKNSDKIIFMFDSKKLHKKYLYTLCKAEEADDIIMI